MYAHVLRSICSSTPSQFENFEFGVFAHQRRLSVDQWIAELPTHSPVAVLDDMTRSKLLGDLRSSLDDLAVDIGVEHETRVTCATRR